MSYKFLSTILGIDANFTGSVGVGTTTPTTKLDVLGGFRLYTGGAAANSHYLESVSTTTNNAYLNLVRNAGAAGTYAYYLNNGVAYLSVDAGSGETRLWANSGGYYLTFFSNGLERMRIPTTGNVLIGTTTDAGYKLDVNGTARIYGASTSSLMIDTVGTADMASSITFRQNSPNWSSSIGTHTSGGGLNYGLQFKSQPSTVNFVINRDGSTYFGGFGLANSSSLVELSSTTKGFLQPRMTTTQRNAIATPATGLAIYNTTTNTEDYYNGTAWVSLQTSITNPVTGTGTTNYLSKWTSSSTLNNSLLYDDGTNVGIGTASPSYKLDVNGTTRFQGNSLVSLNQNAETSLIVSNTTSGTISQANIKATSSGGTNQFGKLSTGWTTYKSLVAEDGYIYNSSSGNISVLNDFGTGNINFTARAGTTAQVIMNGASQPLALVGAGSSNFSMNSGNDVYFAFNSQSATGRIWANPQGTVQYTYDQPSSVGFVGVLAGASVWYGNMNASGGSVKYNASINGVSHSHIWYHNFVEQMRLAYTGNLLIGTSTDAGYKLDVNGTARINSTLSLTNSTYAGTFSFYLSAANTLIASSANIGTWLQVGGGNNVYIVGQAFNSTARGNLFGNTVGGEAISATTIIAQSSGTAATTGLSLRYTINNTGTYVGISRGIYYNPTITSLTGTTHRAIETVVGDVIFGSTSGNVGIGTTTPAYKLDVTGTTKISSLGGGGTQMVVADNTGVLSTQAIPIIPTKSFGAFQEDTTQVAPASNVGYGIKFTIPDISGHGVTMVNDPFGDRTYIEMANAGFYNIQFSCQFQNIDNQLHDVTIWIRKNGNTTADDIPATAGFVSVPNSHGGTPGHCIVAWNYFVEASSGDFFQLVWSTTSHPNVTMEFYPAGSPPPSAASAILTVNQVD